MECYAKAERQGGGILECIEHVESIVSFKENIYEENGFTTHQHTLQAYFPQPKSWDLESLEAALRQAINKHRGVPDIRIQSV